MRSVIGLVLVTLIVLGLIATLGELPFGANHIEGTDTPGRHYLEEGVSETGATNAVTSVVVSYRGFDTLGEVTVLFIAAIGLGVVLQTRRKSSETARRQPASLVLSTGCRFIFPLILVFSAYVFTHGHLTPGGGFQGGVIAASAFLLVYLGCSEKRISRRAFSVVESLGGLVFVAVGILGLVYGGTFLANFLPTGTANTLLSAGVIPVIYVAIGFKVGSELAGIVSDLLEKKQ
jgi:multicomponent Na+:H+ antiporter subunit B